jgi:hypothetical protein
MKKIYLGQFLFNEIENAEGIVYPDIINKKTGKPAVWVPVVFSDFQKTKKIFESKNPGLPDLNLPFLDLNKVLYRKKE